MLEVVIVSHGIMHIPCANSGFMFNEHRAGVMEGEQNQLYVSIARGLVREGGAFQLT